MRFFVGTDHGGIEMRDALAAKLSSWGHEVLRTFGPEKVGQSVDYPDVASELCQEILISERQGSAVFGLLICGTGQGMAISANKIPGIRAGVVSDVFSAKMIREHNNANVICLGQRVLGSELASELLRSFVASEFSGGRHAGRVGKIRGLEQINENNGASECEGILDA